MDPYSLVEFVLLLRSFAKGANDVRSEDEEFLATVPLEYQMLIRNAGRRIIHFAYGGIFMSLVVIPITAPLAVFLTDGIRPFDALCRGVLLLCFAPLTFFLGAYWGLSLGMLTSPRWYLGTDVGVRWRQMCGATSLAGCRLIALTVIVVGTICYLAMFWLTRTMAPFT
jgi:hypothetical protein